MPTLSPVRILRVLVYAALALPIGAAAQTPPLYPSLSGESLLEALALGYSPASTFSYDRARDSLIAVVYREPGDSLRCRYSGLAVYVDPRLDASTAAYNATPRFSTEHLWPQNRGATEGTPAHADLHHLAPVRQSINASRGDDAFGEVPDAEADRWWGPVNGVFSAPPPLAFRDLYGEKRNGSASLMEPPESVKGDLARSMFYVWTVYGPHGGPLARGALDAAFFGQMLPTLLAWSASDPADDSERTRSSTVARWQGTPNPFVVDASLASRAFSGSTPIDAPPQVPVFVLSAPAPNPSFGTVRVTLTLAQPSHVLAVLYDALGREVLVAFDSVASGTVLLSVEAAHLAPGVYLLRAGALDGSAAVSRRFVIFR